MAPFDARREVCIAPFNVMNKVSIFAPHMDESNADFAAHMEGSQAKFAPHMEWRHSFRDHIIAKVAILLNFQKLSILTTYMLGVYMACVTIFDNKNILRENTFRNLYI